MVVIFLNVVKTYFQKFRNVNLQQPQKIVVYRDGVSNSRFTEILATELAGMRTNNQRNLNTTNY